MGDEKNANISQLHSLLEKNQEARDRALLTLGASAIGVSLAFYDKVYAGECLNLLCLSWVLWGVTLLSALWSFAAAAKLADLLNSYYSEISENVPSLTKIRIQVIVSKALNLTSIVAFSVGVVLFVIFAISNVSKEQDMKKKFERVVAPNIETHGLMPPSSMLPKTPENSPLPADAPVCNRPSHQSSSPINGSQEPVSDD